MRIVRIACLLAAAVAAVWACAFDASLREYLTVRFWLPFAKSGRHFEKPNVKRANAPYAGMVAGVADTPLQRLREVYQEIAAPTNVAFETNKYRTAVADARADTRLSAREREEVELIDAKIDMRAGFPEAKTKLQAFLRSARTPGLLSEARGWLAYVHYLDGEHTEAGKIYLDELNRQGSNLSRETILNSLYMNYRDSGGQELIDHLSEYFDTPEHAAFAIQFATNPRDGLPVYPQVKELLTRHADLLRSATGAKALALLSMRTALRFGDPAGAIAIADEVPPEAPVRQEPDFLWMLGSARFLSRDYASAEAPLLALFNSRRAEPIERAAAAYGLCGVYQKLENTVEQIRFALQLHTAAPIWPEAGFGDVSVYWARSGWDLKLLLDAEAPRESLEAFLVKYPDAKNVRLVKYALAVRLSREHRYDEAARVYDSIHAIVRAPRLRRLASLYREVNRTDTTPQERLDAKFAYARFLAENADRVYFNDSLWYGLQNYALNAASDSRLTRDERETLIASERQLRDDQEERWRALQLLREIVREAGRTELGRRAARLGINTARKIRTDRFGRADEVAAADIELSRWLLR